MTMINFHWMAKGNYFKNELLELMDNIYPYKYKSILLPFQTFKNEPLISASFLASNYKDIKFMVAIRPYTISALHLAMAAKTFYDLYGDRLIINFVAGTYDEEYEMFTGRPSSIEDRKKMLYDYLSKFVEFSEGEKYAEIAISGSSENSLKTSMEFADYSINLLSDIDKILNYKKPKMLRVSFAPNKGIKECVFDNPKEANNSFCGNQTETFSFLNSLERRGITDLLVSTTFSEIDNVNILHNMLSDYRAQLPALVI